MFTTANFPGASEADPQRRAPALRAADRPRQRRQCDLAAERVDRRVRVSRHARSAVQPAGVRRLRAGFLARDAEPDAELRPALGSGAAVPGHHRHLRLGDARRSLRRVRHRVRAGRAAVQPLPAGHPRRRRHRAEVHGVRQQRARLQDRMEQLRAEHRRGLAAARAGRLAPFDHGRPRYGDDPWRLLAELQPRAHGPVHRQLRQQPRRRDQREPERDQRQPGVSG